MGARHLYVDFIRSHFISPFLLDRVMLSSRLLHGYLSPLLQSRREPASFIEISLKSDPISSYPWSLCWACNQRWVSKFHHFYPRSTLFLPPLLWLYIFQEKKRAIINFHGIEFCFRVTKSRQEVCDADVSCFVALCMIAPILELLTSKLRKAMLEYIYKVPEMVAVIWTAWSSCSSSRHNKMGQLVYWLN